MPVRHELIHQCRESLTVVALKQVGHLMYHNVFKAVGVFFCEFEVEPNVAALAVAGAPLGLHTPDAPLGNGSADDRLPLFDDSGDSAAELFAVPLLQDCQPSLIVDASGHVQEQSLTVDLDMGTTWTLNHPEAVPNAP